MKKFLAILAFALAALFFTIPAASACGHADGAQKIHRPAEHAAAHAPRLASGVVNHCCCERGSAHAVLFEGIAARPEPRKDAALPFFAPPPLRVGGNDASSPRPPDPWARGFAANFAGNHRLLI